MSDVKVKEVVIVEVVVVVGLRRLGRGSVGGVGGFPPRAEEHVGLGADEVRQKEGRRQNAHADTQRQHLEEGFNVKRLKWSYHGLFFHQTNIIQIRRT